MKKDEALLKAFKKASDLYGQSNDKSYTILKMTDWLKGNPEVRAHVTTIGGPDSVVDIVVDADEVGFL